MGSSPTGGTKIREITAADCKSALGTNRRIGLAVRGFESLSPDKSSYVDQYFERKFLEVSDIVSIFDTKNDGNAVPMKLIDILVLKERSCSSVGESI